MELKGKFIVIEGLDGTGKTSILKELKKIYNGPAVFTREPGGTDCPIAEKIRNLIINNDLDPLTEAYLFAASRANHTQKIKEWLDSGKDVICDRYVYSSLYYQGVMRKLGISNVCEINNQAMFDIEPDIVFYLTVSEEERKKRMENRKGLDRLDKESMNHSKADEEYFRCVKNYSGFLNSIVILNTANKTVVELTEILNQEITRLKTEKYF